ncbi:MAG: UDP-N-acetylmuramate--L-alanine ligase [Oscillospiraceae bacterium]|nr:UDP-N-acetylmuramate--L-alanine ligase [Oscillospiraceae bacterium]
MNFKHQHRGIMSSEEFGRYLNNCKRCHMVGIGGVSMSPLAEILHDMGSVVTGSDMCENTAVEELRELGIKITVGHAEKNVAGADYVVRTAAAREDNAEIKAARAQGIPIFERAEAWGYIMRGYKEAICISGVHGKTTTTSMVSHILLEAKVDPTIMIGGTLPAIESGCHVGKGDIIVLESCEYYNSFHNFHPTVAVVLNIDADHLDFFKNIDGIKDSFEKFASLVPPDGHIVCNGDDENTMQSMRRLNRELITFGFGEKTSDNLTETIVRGINVATSGKSPSMDVFYKGKKTCTIKLRIPGVHNLKNALAATAACLEIGISPEAIENGLYDYTGVGRRFEYKGSYNGADVYDDYAHHPQELSALLDAVATIDSYKRVILAFQPHTFSRTKALFSEFVEQLKRPDIVYLSEIYAARENNEVRISSSDLAAKVEGAKNISSFQDLATEIKSIAQSGDIILTVGAGDIFKVGEDLVGESSKSEASDKVARL